MNHVYVTAVRVLGVYEGCSEPEHRAPRIMSGVRALLPAQDRTQRDHSRDRRHGAQLWEGPHAAQRGEIFVLPWLCFTWWFGVQSNLC